MGILSNLLGLSSKSVAGVATENVTNSITQSCNTGDTNSVVAENVSIKVSNIDCANVQLVMQSVSTDEKCTEDASMEQVANTLAAQLEAAEKAANAPAKMSLFGISVSSTDLSIREKIKQSIQQTCGNGDTASTVFDNVSIDMSGVSCDDLSFITQKSSFTSVCALQGAQDAMNKNPAIAQAPIPGQSNGVVDELDLIVIAGAILLAVCLAAFFVVRYTFRKQHERIQARVRIETGQATRAPIIGNPRR